MTRAKLPPPDIATVVAQIELSYRIADVRAKSVKWEAANEELCTAILDAAASFASDVLEPLNFTMDSRGCVVVDGRVVTSGEHRAAWKSFVDNGWPTLEMSESRGGQALPAILAFAAQEQFDRACPAFGMLSVPQRSAYRVIDAFGSDAIKDVWLDNLASGAWGATICVSESDAGSDLRRVSTSARRDANGNWTISGEKMWISFGGHDLTPQIGHIVLAVTPKDDGKRGLSLFLVPMALEDGSRNSVEIRRIEEKLGLHGSPTCLLGFEDAQATLLGEAGQGLAQLFVMITNMRLAVGAMGLGIASGLADLAASYAETRVQGGRPTPVAIASHPDVALQLLDLIAPATLLRGLIFAAANCADLGRKGDAEAAALAAWLLPIVKTSGGQVAFQVASGAIQVLGGAGYTREWPAEQGLRDARVLTIFEGTTGMQAQDLVLRRMLADRTSFDSFLQVARESDDSRLAACLDIAQAVAERLRSHPDSAEAAATATLQLAIEASFAWIAAGYVNSGTHDRTLRAASEHFLDGAPARARMIMDQIERAQGASERYAALRAE